MSFAIDDNDAAADSQPLRFILKYCAISEVADISYFSHDCHIMAAI